MTDEIQEAMDNIPKYTNDAHAMGCWAYTYQEVIWEALKNYKKEEKILKILKHASSQCEAIKKHHIEIGTIGYDMQGWIDEVIKELEE